MPLIQEKRIRKVICRTCGKDAGEFEISQVEDNDQRVYLTGLPEGWISLEAELAPGRLHIYGKCPDCNGPRSGMESIICPKCKCTKWRKVTVTGIIADTSREGAIEGHPYLQKKGETVIVVGCDNCGYVALGDLEKKLLEAII